MFKQLGGVSEQVTIEIDAVEVLVPAGVSVAAALLYLGRLPTRCSSVSATPRAPFCMMGACFECLVEIDGLGLQRACQQVVQAGMKLRLLLPPETVTES